MTQPFFVTIGELFQDSKYSIPLYQREYAWTIEHISQLLSDIASNAFVNSKANYYWVRWFYLMKVRNSRL